MTNAVAASGATIGLSHVNIPAWPQSPALTQGPVTEDSVPAAARISITDLLDHGAHLRAGQKVLLVAYLDGLYGGDNLVDRQAIHWILHAIEQRGNAVEVLWVDEPARMHAWEFPDVVRKAMDRSDLVINHSFDLTMEEILAFRRYVEHEHSNVPVVRNFATTAPLLCSTWAQTPQELVSEIRYQASQLIQPGLAWTLTDPNGTHLQGIVMPSRMGGKYAVRREQSNTYLPWPEWICPPIVSTATSGQFTFDRMLSWWSRYIGIPPYFDQPVTLKIQDNRIVEITGGMEADAIRRFLASLQERLGESTYDFDALHFGVHPHARVSPQQCPSILYRRLIEHSDTHNLHVHVGSGKATASYPYWPHITGDIRHATFRIGDNLILDQGNLTALTNPAVIAVAAKYPGRPGLGPEPFQG